MKFNPRLTLLLFVFIAGTAQAQYYKRTSQRGFGFLIEGTFSGLYQHGLTPSITFGNDCHTIQIGPRFGAAAFGGDKGRYKFVIDGGYRLYYLHKTWVSLFGSFRTEYAKRNIDDTYYYNSDALNNTPGVFLGEGQFRTNHIGHEHHINFYLGTGAEFTIMENVYFKTEVLFGFKTASGEATYSNADTGDHISDSKYLFKPQGTSLLVSGGIGYKF